MWLGDWKQTQIRPWQNIFPWSLFHMTSLVKESRLSFWTPAFPWSLFRVTSLVKKIFFSSSTPLHDFSLSEYWCYYQASCLFVYLTPGLLQLSFCWPTCCHIPCPSKPSEHWCSRCTTLYVTALTHFLPWLSAYHQPYQFKTELSLL